MLNRLCQSHLVVVVSVLPHSYISNPTLLLSHNTVINIRQKDWLLPLLTCVIVDSTEDSHGRRPRWWGEGGSAQTNTFLKSMVMWTGESVEYARFDANCGYTAISKKEPSNMIQNTNASNLFACMCVCLCALYISACQTWWPQIRVVSDQMNTPLATDSMFAHHHHHHQCMIIKRISKWAKASSTVE